MIRIIERLLGERNVDSICPNSVVKEFGNQILVGKKLAVVPDLKISYKTDQALLTTLLKSITGEDIYRGICLRDSVIKEGEIVDFPTDS